MPNRLIAALSLCLCTLSPLVAQQAETTPASADESITHKTAQLKTVLDQYVGRWVGTFEILNLKQVIQTIEIEQQYWWDEVDGVTVLKGQAVMASMGDLSTSTSRTYIEKGKIYTETVQGTNEHFFQGIVSDEGKRISWISVNDDSILGRKLTDSFSEDSEGQLLLVDGYEEVTIGGRVAMLTMRGKMRKASSPTPVPSSN